MTYLKFVFRSRNGQIEKMAEITLKQFFGVFISHYVSTLIERGLIEDAEAYKAYMVPRYDDQANYGREVVYIETAEKMRFDSDERAGWESEQQANGELVRYFTLMLRTSPQQLVYKKDFPFAALQETLVSWLETFDPALAAAIQKEWTWELIALGTTTGPLEIAVSSAQLLDTWSVLIFVGPLSSPVLEEDTPSEDAVDISVESIEAFSTEAEESVSISIEDIVFELPVKSLPIELSVGQGSKLPGDLHILIARNSLEALTKDLSESGAVGRGLLIGEAFKEAETGELVVAITTHIPATIEGAVTGGVWSSANMWESMLRVKEQYYPDAQIVGWYRNHYFCTWLSTDDEFFQKHIFKEPWHIILMLDRYNGTKRFYHWKGEQIVENNFFQILE